MKSSIITESVSALLLCSILCVCATACSVNTNDSVGDENLQKALNFCFVCSDSSKYYLNLIDTISISKNDRPYYDFLIYSIRSINNIRILDVAKVDKMIAFFESKKDYYYAGEAAYLEAIYYHRLDKMKMASCFKESEHYFLLSGKEPPLLISLNINSCLAYAFYLDNMKSEATKYALQALPYAEKLGNPFPLSDIYRDLLSNASDSVGRKQIDEYYNKGLFYARQQPDSVMSYELQYIYAQKYSLDKVKKLEVAKSSCTKTRLRNMAYNVADFYLEEHQLDSAVKYLNILGTENNMTLETKDKYLELESRLLYEKKDYKYAYDKLSELYNIKKLREDTTQLAGTYVTVRHSDEMYEQEEILKEQAKTQIHRVILITLIVVLTLAFVIALLLLLYYKEQKRLQLVKNENLQTKHELALQQEQAKIDRMAAELKAMQDVLKEKLRQRLEITKRLQIDVLKGQTTDKLPQWVQQLLNDYTFTDKSKWKAFRQEYNHATNNELDRLQKEYPSLTEADIQYIALSKLELNVEEMCILLGCTNRTIWNKKQIVRTKLGLPVSPGRASKA